MNNFFLFYHWNITWYRLWDLPKRISKNNFLEFFLTTHLYICSKLFECMMSYLRKCKMRKIGLIFLPRTPSTVLLLLLCSVRCTLCTLLPVNTIDLRGYENAGPLQILIFWSISIFQLSCLLVGRRAQCTVAGIVLHHIHWNIKSSPASPGRSRVGPALYEFSLLTIDHVHVSTVTATLLIKYRLVIQVLVSHWFFQILLHGSPLFSLAYALHHLFFYACETRPFSCLILLYIGELLHFEVLWQHF